MEEITLASSFDGTDIPLYYRPARGTSDAGAGSDAGQGAGAPPRGVVQFIHGMADHARRNHYLFEALAAAGYAIYAPDLRGHGALRLSAGTDRAGEATAIIFAERHGLEAVISDLHDVRREIERRHPGVPFFLIGHSLGSLLARVVAAGAPDSYRGIVLFGLVGPIGPLAPIGRLVATVGRLVRGPARPNRVFKMLTFDTYARTLKEEESDLDWLTRDPAEVAAYREDPLAGGPFSSPFAGDVVRATVAAHSKGTVRALGSGPAVAIFVGAADPVPKFGAEARRVARMIEGAGNRDVTVHMYPGARHELHHEINRDEVFHDLIGWLDERRADTV